MRYRNSKAIDTTAIAIFRGYSLAWAVLLLLVFFAVRLYEIETFPIFIDEAVHLDAQTIIRNDVAPTYGIQMGRQFMLWSLIPFQIEQSHDPIWLGRMVAQFANVLTLAILLRWGMRLGGIYGALGAGVLWGLNSYTLFYGRLLLADVFSTTLIVAVGYLGSYVAHKPRRQAVLVGILVFIAYGTRVASLPYIGILLASWLTVPHQQPLFMRLRQRTLWFAFSLMTGVGFIVALEAVLRWRGYSLISNPFSMVTGTRYNSSGTLFDLERILSNLGHILVDSMTMLSILGVFMALGILLLIRRGRFYLPLVIIAPLLVMALSVAQHGRYWYPAIALASLPVAYWLGQLKVGRMFMLVVIMLISAAMAVQYQITLQSDVTQLALPMREKSEYLLSDASGEPFADVADFLREADAQRVIGLLSSCNGLRYTAPDLPIECPRILLDRSAIPEHEALIAEAQAQAGTYIVLEDTAYVPASIDASVVFERSRPTGLATLTVYDMAYTP